MKNYLQSTFKSTLIFSIILLSGISGCATFTQEIKAVGDAKEDAQALAVKREVFFVGGKYIGPENQPVMDGQMYVETLTPQKILHPYPLVLIHGAGQTSVNWLTTPDGRTGWAEFFVNAGYKVVLVDQPRRGRSAWHPVSGLSLRSFDTRIVQRLFTAPEAGSWPQAKLHSQWPGTGKIGDPIFDQFAASQVEFVASNEETQKSMQLAGAELLDRIGPAIFITHSQAGPFGWLIADARPKLVKGIVAIEPQGPPMQDAVLGNAKARPWGITDIALTYDGKTDLNIQGELGVAEKNDLVPCWTQKKPAKQLTNLKTIPILIVVGEASYHAPYDHCTANWLTQSGVKNEFIRLEDQGIHGNGHMQMLEKNNLEIARFIKNWTDKVQ